MRVHELAKELGSSSKEILAKLHGLGVEAASHMSTIDDDAVALIREESSPAAKAPATGPRDIPKTEAAPAKPVPKTEVSPAKPENPIEKKTPEARPAAAKPAAPGGEKVIRIRSSVIVKEFAELINMRPPRLIAELMSFNVLASINERIDADVARKIAEKHGFKVEKEKRAGEPKQHGRKEIVEEVDKADRPEDLLPRPPVVTFLGHVDHGKTSLLDKIRDTAVAAGESGGITQHIGASTVDVNGRSITFLDTPGHAAFTAMRARGANMTDIAVIIIAADDGIMPQTREAIMHAKAARVALMVAINKIDLPAANVDRVLQQLQTEGLAPEAWGGETICCPVSAQTGDGISHLLEMILLQSEVLELKANPRKRATGFVIEAQLEPGMGPTASVLITGGTLKIGDPILCGQHWGRVKALINDHGAKVKHAGPSTPVKCLGLSGVPEAGADFRVCSTDKVARSIAEKHAQTVKSDQLTEPKKASLENIFDQLVENEKLELNVILKADTQGSIEAIIHSLKEIKSDKVSLNIILSGTGNITVNDVMLASASNAVILGFHVAKEPGVGPACKREGVETRLHQIIYKLIEEVEEGMTGLLAPEYRETITGQAEIRAVFQIGKKGNVAGCFVTKGNPSAKNKVRVKRGDEVLFEGSLASLKRFQDSVSEVKEGQECGIRIEKFNNFQENDILEFYSVEELKQSL